jgi:16S rRNA (cytosine1402-N4)-methyltransferase
MRMDPEQGISAAVWIAAADQAEIADVLKRYGDEKFARRIAGAIVRARAEKAITRTAQLAAIIAEAHPAWPKNIHPATLSFQAIRIHINNELGELESVLAQSLDILAIGGRLLVISFHSLEDRIVKRFIREQERGDSYPPGVPVTQAQMNPRLRKLGKAVSARPDELEENVRSRSAVLRVAERLA